MHLRTAAAKETSQRPRIVIVGGGFAGLYAAKALANKAVEVILIDRKNHHTFQPLLYQVALALLAPGEIAASLRHILRKAPNVHTILGEVTGFTLAAQRVKLANGAELDYDYLLVAAGARHAYFGHDEWAQAAPGLKTIEDAVKIRSQLLLAFETAERAALLSGTQGRRCCIITEKFSKISYLYFSPKIQNYSKIKYLPELCNNANEDEEPQA